MTARASLGRKRQPTGDVAELRRLLPPRGRKLNFASIRGLWRPSGAVAGSGCFAVVWQTQHVIWWAPLHDFDDEARRRLLAECEWQDRCAGYPGAWPRGRAE